MKDILRTLAFTLIMLISSLSVYAHTNDLPNEKTPTALQEQRLLEIQARVNEIKALDKSKLTKAERNELRSELKALKKEAPRRGGGIYISTAAAVLIILLLIVLL